jgi:protein involved in polysaccharide export with SLBB domain
VGKPDVHISLVEARSKMYYVLGGVWAPGIYRMGGEVIRLREAIARAGLFREYRADQTRVGVITPDPAKPTYVIANAKKIMMGDDSENLIVKAGDVIFVQDKIIYDVDGFLYTLFRETENVSTADKAVKFWEDAVKGDIGDFTYPRSSVTVVY